MLRAVLGGPVQPLSAKRGLQAIKWETDLEIRKLRAKLARALENRDAPEAKSIAKQIMGIQLRRRRLKLPNPKASEAVIAGMGG